MGAVFEVMCWTTVKGLLLEQRHNKTPGDKCWRIICWKANKRPRRSRFRCLLSFSSPSDRYSANFPIENSLICNLLSPEHQALIDCRTNCNSIVSLVVQHPQPQVLASTGKENAPNDTHISQQAWVSWGGKRWDSQPPNTVYFIFSNIMACTLPL